MGRVQTDIVVLGAGSGGYACALRAAQLGLTVTLIEEDKIGGTCLHKGCIPTKALLHAAEIADGTRNGSAVGIDAHIERVDMIRLGAYAGGVVERLYNGLTGLVKQSGINAVTGRGQLTGPNTVLANGIEYHGTSVVLATGSSPRTLPGIELSERVITSDEALRLRSLPARILVIGGSVIGVEFASAWRSLGAEVTVVEALASLVPGEEPVLGRHLLRAFRKRGIATRLSTRVEAVEEGTDEISVSLSDGTRLQCDLVLVAVGRGPSTTSLDLEAHGVATDRGWVTTDAYLRTSVASVFAVGDLVPGPQLAHRGFAHGVFVAEHLAGLEPEPVVDRYIPRVTYCDPEIASVGLREDEARSEFGSVEAIDYSLAGNGKSQMLGTAGLVRVVRRSDGPIVGVHMIGSRIGEQIGEATMMVGWEALPEDVARFVHAHPTQNEALGEVAMVAAGRPLHAHG